VPESDSRARLRFNLAASPSDSRLYIIYQQGAWKPPNESSRVQIWLSLIIRRNMKAQFAPILRQLAVSRPQQITIGPWDLIIAKE
jgi:hypothetical protein